MTRRPLVRRTLSLALGIALGITATGCARATGPRVRFATATAAELAAVENEERVWYEFQPGDAVPLRLLVVGVAEGMTQPPMRIEAARPFWIVFTEGRPPMFSFDGERVTRRSATVFLDLARDDESDTNQVILVVYIGDPRNLPEHLK